MEIIGTRTPGFATWQGNAWLFSETDALVFEGEASGGRLLKVGDTERIAACRAALAEGDEPEDFALRQIETGGELAVYLFRDRATGRFRAYADMSRSRADSHPQATLLAYTVIGP